MPRHLCSVCRAIKFLESTPLPGGFLHIDVSTIKGLMIFVRCGHIISVRGCMTTQGDHPIQIVAAYWPSKAYLIFIF
jgi:hypothetical protein